MGVEVTPVIMGIIKNVGIGMRDAPFPCLHFHVMTDESTGSLQILNWSEAGRLIEENHVVDVNDLEGKPCWVEHTPGKMVFKRLCRIKK